MKLNNFLKEEDGFVLILGLMILLILSILGVAGLRTSSTQLLIIGNERQISQDIYTADSAWPITALWLNDKTMPPERKNPTYKGTDTTFSADDDYYKIVRNYGDGDDSELNDDFDPVFFDGSILGSNFWYQIKEDSNEKAEKFDSSYRQFVYDCDTTVASGIAIDVRLKKVYKVGYN